MDAIESVDGLAVWVTVVASSPVAPHQLEVLGERGGRWALVHVTPRLVAGHWTLEADLRWRPNMALRLHAAGLQPSEPVAVSSEKNRGQTTFCATSALTAR